MDIWCTGWGPCTPRKRYRIVRSGWSRHFCTILTHSLLSSYPILNNFLSYRINSFYLLRLCKFDMWDCRCCKRWWSYHRSTLRGRSSDKMNQREISRSHRRGSSGKSPLSRSGSSHHTSCIFDRYYLHTYF